MSKDKKDKGKGKGWEVRENARNWVPDEAGGRHRFDTKNRQGKEPLYSDLPGLRNTGMMQRDDQQLPYASDSEGRQYEYVVRQAMPQGGKFKDEDGNKYRETWQYVGATPEEQQYRGDDVIRTGGDDVWQRVITPIQKQKSKPADAPAPSSMPVAANPAVTAEAAASQAPSASYIQPGPTTTAVSAGEQFLQDYMSGNLYGMSTTPVYYDAAMQSIYSEPLSQALPTEEEEALAWYDMPY